MLIIGCDYHPSFQQVSFVDTETGECGQRRLDHSSGEAESFYRGLRGSTVRVGMEASGHGRWFERLLAELGYELWIGDPAKIRAAEVRRQKTDRRDAEHLLQLLLEDRFPRIWVPTLAERDLRQLVLHRHRLVGLRTRVKNQLQAVALNEGMQRKKRLWSKKGREEFEQLRLLPWAGRRRGDLLALLDGFDGSITQLSQAVEQEAQRRPEVRRLMTHPGVGPLTALVPASRDADDRSVGAVWLRQASRQLPGTDPQRAFQRRTATPGPHQQARQHADALAAGGSGSCRSSIRSSVATALHPPEPASATIRRYRRYGP